VFIHKSFIAKLLCQFVICYPRRVIKTPVFGSPSMLSGEFACRGIVQRPVALLPRSRQTHDSSRSHWRRRNRASCLCWWPDDAVLLVARGAITPLTVCRQACHWRSALRQMSAIGVTAVFDSTRVHHIKPFPLI
jgi:hypothetical protein